MKKIARSLNFLWVLFFLGAAPSDAQQPKTYDLTDQEPSVQQLVDILRPSGSERVRSRGVGQAHNAPVCTALPNVRTRGVAVSSKAAVPIEFESNSDLIQDSAEGILEKLATVIRQLQSEGQGYCILIAGHTDSLGSEEHNLKLSFRRGESVKQYLVDEFNLDPQVFLVQGYGEFQPLSPNDSETNRRRNRRVEFQLFAPTDSIP